MPRLLTICVNCGAYGSLPTDDPHEPWPIAVTCQACPHHVTRCDTDGPD